VYDANIQLPAIVATYRIPGKGTRDAKVLDMLTRYLSGGASSKLYKKMVDDKKNALQVGAFSISLEDFGAYMTFAIPNNNTSLTELLKDVDEEVLKVQQSLISEEDYQKLMNQVENDYVSTNSRMLNVAENLAENYYIYGKTGHINQVLDEYRQITRQDMLDVAKKYLVNDRRLVLYYLPQSTGK
jgi:predicted Zn-dependent peptidase